jgi:hypothetical protein
VQSGKSITPQVWGMLSDDIAAREARRRRRAMLKVRN